MVDIRRPQPTARGARARSSKVSLRPFGGQHPGPPTPFLVGCIPVLRCLLQLAGRLAPYFGHLPGAFREVFYWVQKATLGSSLTKRVPAGLLWKGSVCRLTWRTSPWSPTSSSKSLANIQLSSSSAQRGKGNSVLFYACLHDLRCTLNVASQQKRF